MNTLPIPGAPSEVAKQNTIIPLPEGLPETFQRRWNDGHWEVMVEGNVWKFSPPDKEVVKNIKELQDTLVLLPPFLGDPELVDLLQDVVGVVTDKWLIEDHFPKHNLRRDFADTPEGEDISEYTKKISKMRATFHYLTMLTSYLRDTLSGQGVAPKLDNVSRDIFFLPFSGREFDEKTFPEKVQFLKEIDSAIIKYLETVLHAVTAR